MTVKESPVPDHAGVYIDFNARKKNEMKAAVALILGTASLGLCALGGCSLTVGRLAGWW